MNDLGLRQRLRLNERVSLALIYLIAGLMAVSLSVPAVALAQRLFPGWDGGYLRWVCLLVAFESLAAQRAARRLPWPSVEAVLFRCGELAVLGLGLKAWIYARRGWGQALADLPGWLHDFESFFDGEYLLGLGLVLATWLAAWWLGRGLEQMEGDEALMDQHGPIVQDRLQAQRDLAEQVGTLGAVLLGLTALLRGSALLTGQAPGSTQWALLNLLAYFMLGLALLALSQFARLRFRWSVERIPIRHNLALRWAAHSAALILGAALLVGLLPTRYALGLLDSLRAAAGLLSVLIYLGVSLALLPLSLLIALINRLFGAGEAVPTVIEPPALPAGPPAGAEGAAALPWLDVLRSLAFWAIFLSILIYSLTAYLRQRPEFLAALGRLPGWAAWLAFWRGLRRRLGAAGLQLAEAAGQAVSRLRRRGRAGRWGYVNPRRLPPREQVRFFYLALLRRGGQAGFPRRPSQTPYEYQADLQQKLPEAQSDVSDLTSAYVQARYGPQPVPPSLADLARRRWEQVRRALRSAKKKKPG